MGQHWYEGKTGKPAHWEGKGGKSTTLREARVEGLLPSVSGIQGITNKPRLNNWWQKQVAIMTATIVASEAHASSDVNTWTLSDLGSGWTKRVIKAVKDEVSKTADAGSDIHDKLEHYPNVPDEYFNICYGVYDNIFQQTEIELEDWIHEQTFANTEHFYGGMCDLHNEFWVIDFKTKDGDVSEQKGWPDQSMQLHAYAHGLKIPDARLANVFITRDRDLWDDPQKAVKFYEHKNDPLVFQKFIQLCRYWQLDKKYGPFYEKFA